MSFAGHLLCSHTEMSTSGRSVCPINVWGSLRSERSAPQDEPSSIRLLRGISFFSIEHHSILPIAALTGRGDFGDGVYQRGPASYCKTYSRSLGTVVVQGADTGMGAQDEAAPQWEQQPRSDGFHTHTASGKVCLQCEFQST